MAVGDDQVHVVGKVLPRGVQAAGKLGLGSREVHRVLDDLEVAMFVSQAESQQTYDGA